MSCPISQCSHNATFGICSWYYFKSSRCSCVHEEHVFTTFGVHMTHRFPYWLYLVIHLSYCRIFSYLTLNFVPVSRWQNGNNWPLNSYSLNSGFSNKSMMKLLTAKSTLLFFFSFFIFICNVKFKKMTSYNNVHCLRTINVMQLNKKFETRVNS